MQTIEESQTRCLKGWTMRSSLVFYTISLKQISPLTLSLWCFEIRGRLPPKIKWSNDMKMKHLGSCSTNYSMPLSLSLTQMNELKSHWESFLRKKVLFHEWEIMKLYVTSNWNTISEITTMHRLWLNNKIIKYYY